MLKKLRVEAGMTQFELAVKSGVKLSNIQKWEQKGIESARFGSAVKLADALGCKVDDLI